MIISFLLFSRCYTAVEPLHDREDRDSACRQIVALSRVLAKSSFNLAQMDIAQCLNDIAMAPSGPNLTKIPPSASTDVSTVPKLSATTNDKALLASLTTFNSPLGAVHTSLARLASCVAEANAISLDMAAITRQLWATRQSVMEFDLAQQKASSSASSEKSNTDSSGLTEWPDYEALDDLFGTFKNRSFRTKTRYVCFFTRCSFPVLCADVFCCWINVIRKRNDLTKRGAGWHNAPLAFRAYSKW